MRRVEAAHEVHHLGRRAAVNSHRLPQLQYCSPSRSFLSGVLNHWRRQEPGRHRTKAMLLALQSAVEAYLESPVPVADLVVPMTISERGKETLDSASSSAGFNRVARMPVSGSLAAMANDIGPFYQRPERFSYDDDLPEQLVLTVEYSRPALTAILYLEKLCVF